MAVINNVEKGGVSEVPVSSHAVAGPQEFRTRFKIVKVETTEPLKRGRWTCFDFVDKPASKQDSSKSATSTSSTSATADDKSSTANNKTNITTTGTVAPPAPAAAGAKPAPANSTAASRPASVAASVMSVTTIRESAGESGATPQSDTQLPEDQP